MSDQVRKILKIPVEVYSRVVGYFRPVHQWNAGKREEFKQRKTYRLKNEQKKTHSQET